MESQFEYYAFISYKREDEKWAKWLQKKLENYKLPTVIRKEIPRLPKRIRPVFRDKTDLGAGLLTESLKSELSRSQYLIVICSPQAAQSEWVGNEINAYIEMGRTDHIIPFIVYGDPNSKDAVLECFHPVIREKMPEPLGINIQEIGKEQAFIKVVAKILGLRFDSVWNRHRRSMIRKRIVMACVAFLILCGLGFVWDYNRIKYEYYADYVDKGGIAQGVVPFKKSEIEKRNSHYRFEKSRYKLRKVVYANSAGTPKNHSNTEYTDRPSILVYTYKDNGRLDFIECQNAQEKTIITQFFGGKNYDRIDLKNSPTGESSATLAASFTSIDNNLFSDKNSTNNKAEIKRYKLTRDKNGYIIRKEFKRYNGDDAINACDASGIWGFEYVLDNLGRPIELRYLGWEGYLPDKVGAAKRKYKYDKHGNICKAEYLGIDNKYILNEQFWAKMIRISDENGNCTEGAYFDIDSKPCFIKKGYSKIINQYDKKGNLIESAYFGVDGKPCFIKDGYAKCTAKYDDRGNWTEIAYYGLDNKLCFTKEGYAKQVIKYDNRSNPIEMMYFGVDGKLCFIKDGYAKETVKYDDQGNEIERVYFDIKGKPCYIKDGFAKTIFKYDDKGNPAEMAYFDIDNEPCYSNGCAKITVKYDDRGNQIERVYFDIKAKPCYIKDGYAKCTAKYDDRGNQIECIYFDIYNRPCKNVEGYAKWTAKYDDRGNRIERACFDVDNNPCYSREGCAKLTIKYSDRGNPIESEYFDTKDKLCYNNGGWAKLTVKYDDRGNSIENAYFNTKGKPCYIIDGYAKCTAKYDNRGNKTEFSLFDAEGKPCYGKDGYSKETTKYDERGNQIAFAFFDTEGKFCHHIDGYAKCTAKYDVRGNKTEFSFFDAEGNPCYGKDGYSKRTSKYDVRGNCIEVAYFDVNKNFVISKKINCAREILIYNALGQTTKYEQYDENGKLMHSSRKNVLLFGQIVDPTGSVYSAGYRNNMYIFECNDWNVYKSLEDFKTVMFQSADTPKRIVFIDAKDNHIEEHTFGKGKLGLHLMDETTFEENRYNQYIQIYKNWKQNKK